MTLPNEIECIVSQNDKGDNPKRPDYRGEVKIAGVTYDLAAWKRVKQGTTRQFISGKLTIKAPKADPGAYQGAEGVQTPASQPKPAPNAANPDEDVPF